MTFQQAELTDDGGPDLLFISQVGPDRPKSARKQIKKHVMKNVGKSRRMAKLRRKPFLAQIQTRVVNSASQDPGLAHYPDTEVGLEDLLPVPRPSIKARATHSAAKLRPRSTAPMQLQSREVGRARPQLKRAVTGLEHPVQKDGAQGNLTFLNFTKLDEHKNVSNREIIRSKAISYARQPKQHSRNIAPTALRTSQSVGRNEIVVQPCKSPYTEYRAKYRGMLLRDNRAMLLNSSLHTRTTNLPDGLPVTAPKYAPMFLHYSLMKLIVRIFLSPNVQENTPESPINPVSTALVPAALSQQIFLEATMYMVSTHLDVLRDTASSRTTLFHRGQSLKLINEQLQQQKTSPSDLLISTVLGLVNYDNVNGQLVESTAHMAGMRTMVTLRGGLRYLGMNGVLGRMIILSDFMGAALGTSESIFQLSELQVENPNRDSLGILPVRKAVYGHSLSLEAYGIPEKIGTLLNMVREVNMEFTTIEGVQWTEKSAVAFFDASSRLRRKLYTLAKDITNEDRLHPKYYQYECCSLAAQIYVESILSPLGFLTPINDCYVRELSLALSEANCLGDWKPIPEALVWVSLVGGAAAKDRPERRYMIAHLGPPMMALGMLYFEDLITSMLLFTRLTKLCHTYFNSR